VALCAAGIAPARALRATLLVALGSGLLGVVLADQVVPRLLPALSRVEAALEDRERADDSGRAVAWRSRDTLWSVQHALGDAARYDGVAAVRGDRVILAASLHFDAGAWHLSGIDAADALGAAQVLGRTADAATPAQLGLDAPPPPDELAERLRPDHERPSHDLFASRAPRRWAILVERLMAGIVPALCLLFALPRFIRFDDRHRPALAAMRAALWAVPPLLGVVLLNRLLLATTAQPVLFAIGLAGVLTTIGVLRWRRMAL
jgi:hypothetical protein